MAYELNAGRTVADHRLELLGREHLTVSGVEDVERFDENCIVMATCVGTLVVTGEELHQEECECDQHKESNNGKSQSL